MSTKPWGDNKEEGPFVVDAKWGENMKKEEYLERNILKMKNKDPNDRGSNDRVKKLENKCAKNYYKYEYKRII